MYSQRARHMLDSEFDDLFDSTVGNGGVLGDLIVRPSFQEGRQEGLGLSLALLGLGSELFVDASFNREVGHVAGRLTGDALG